MARVLFFYTIDKVLEVIAVPFITQAFSYFVPLTGITLAMFGKLVIAALPLAEEMCADEV